MWECACGAVNEDIEEKCYKCSQCTESKETLVIKDKITNNVRCYCRTENEFDAKFCIECVSNLLQKSPVFSGGAKELNEEFFYVKAVIERRLLMWQCACGTYNEDVKNKCKNKRCGANKDSLIVVIPGEKNNKQEVNKIEDKICPIFLSLKSKYPYVRKNAAWALGEIGDAKAAIPLLNALKDEERIIQNVAEEALHKIGKSAVDPLITALREDTVVSYEKVTEVLDKIKPDWFESDVCKKQLYEFVGALEHGNPIIRKNAAKVLAAIGDSKAIEPLISALRDTDAIVQKEVAKALLKIDLNALKTEAAKKQIHDFIKAMNNENWNVRWWSAWALGRIGDPVAVEPLIAALRDEDGGVQGKAAEALNTIHPNWQNSDMAKRQVPEFIKALKDKNIEVRSTAAEALGKIRDARALEHLIAALRDEDSETRKQAAVSLKNIDPDWVTSEYTKKQVPEFINVLKGSDFGPQRYTAWVLGKIGDVRALEQLISLLADTKNPNLAFEKRYGTAIQIDNRALPAVIVMKDWMEKEVIQIREEIKKAIDNIITLNQHTFCASCILKGERKQAKIRGYFYILCRCCGSSLHLISNVKQVIGLIGGDVSDYRQDGEKVYVNLWFESDKKTRNADIDVLEIHESNGINYDYAVNAVLNVLKNDVSRPRKYVKGIPVIIGGNPPLSENSLSIMKNEFGGISVD